MASYAPAFGMVGTLLGLINLMDLVGGGDMAAIGSQLAIALITTFYGVLLANLVFKPIAVKLERRTERRRATQTDAADRRRAALAGDPAAQRDQGAARPSPGGRGAERRVTQLHAAYPRPVVQA